MNFLVSKNPLLIAQYWRALQENGASLLLSDFSDLLWRAKTSDKGLALIDGQADGFADINHIAHLKRINPVLKVLMIAADISTEDELSALTAGASGSCQQNLSADKIRQIFTTVQDGGVWISSASLPHLLQRLKRLESLSNKNPPTNVIEQKQEKLAALTHREREIVELVTYGDSNKMIASKLSITDHTVKVHLSVVFRKLHVHDRLQLALLANQAFNNKPV